MLVGEWLIRGSGVGGCWWLLELVLGILWVSGVRVVEVGNGGRK